MSEIFDPQFWEDKWKKAARLGEKRSNKEKIEKWNERADNFNINVSTPSGQVRIQETIKFLEEYGALEKAPEATKYILDIGCGPGHYAIEFARRGYRVYALDPAEKMIEKLKEKMSQERAEVCERITPMVEDWLELDIYEQGFSKIFDLVFSSMSPATQDVNNLKKAIECSKKYCYISAFAGSPFRKSITTLLERHLGEEKTLHLDIFYPLNWLYSSGYKPVLCFNDWNRLHRQPKEEAKAEIKKMLEMFIEVDEKIDKDIEEYVETHEEEGYLTEEKGATSGMILFDVNGECCNLV